ncbi:apyrase [Cardiosporidium cionae]|uniref:Apyrase n=1 Tax=Cardiosporidium cionae TaxID=476202 RepID=A0ABQ7J6A0_9APIC|nr:apyrase [Cardiosporidium cionae]|eukprot:KAF8819526.1 apyrase [Cardiosporidium cionae]
MLSRVIHSISKFGLHIGRDAIQFGAPCESYKKCRFMIIADLDEKSLVRSWEGNTFRSYQKIGYLEHTNGNYSVNWEPENEITSLYNYKDRGMELSELINFNGDLLSFDDRTGIVYKHFPNGDISPQYILTEGDGTQAKGMKIEWVTIKDGELWIGSFGKEFVDLDGRIVHEHPMWVTVINSQGKIRRHNWKVQYDLIRSALSAPPPGYCIHEAINWSEAHQRWYILPRRLSTEPYDEKLDEVVIAEKGTNVLVVANEDFSKIEILTVGQTIAKRGFSSFKFVPGTNDTLLLALKTEEDSVEDTQESFITLFTKDGTILFPDSKIPGSVKYEGIEFV